MSPSNRTASPWGESVFRDPVARSTTHHPWDIVPSSHLIARTATDRASPPLTLRCHPSGSPSSFRSRTAPFSRRSRCRPVTAFSGPVRVMTVSP